jgi:hypothetical protein
MTIDPSARGEVHEKVDTQTGSGPWMACMAVNGVFVIGIGGEASAVQVETNQVLHRVSCGKDIVSICIDEIM